LEPNEDAVILKNLLLQLEATALASIVLPVPGGPKSKIPFHGFLKDVSNNSGYKIG